MVLLQKVDLCWWEGRIWNEQGEVFIQGPGPLDKSQWGNDEEPIDHISDFVGFLPWDNQPKVLLRTLRGRTVEAQVFEGKLLDDAAVELLGWANRGGHAQMKASRQDRQHRLSSTYLPEEQRFRNFALFLVRSKQVFVA